MVEMKLILYSQYLALALLALLFLISFLIKRKKSAVASVLNVILFAVSLTGSAFLLYFGTREEFWTMKTLYPFSVWSWIGVGLVGLFFALRLFHAIDKANARRVAEKEWKKAEKAKEAAEREAQTALESAPEAPAAAPIFTPCATEEDPKAFAPAEPHTSRAEERRTLNESPNLVYDSHPFEAQASETSIPVPPPLEEEPPESETELSAGRDADTDTDADAFGAKEAANVWASLEDAPSEAHKSAESAEPAEPKKESFFAKYAKFLK